MIMDAQDVTFFGGTLTHEASRLVGVGNVQEFPAFDGGLFLNPAPAIAGLVRFYDGDDIVFQCGGLASQQIIELDIPITSGSIRVTSAEPIQHGLKIRLYP